MQINPYIILTRIILFFSITVTIIGFYYLGWYKPLILGGLTIGYFGIILSFITIILFNRNLFPSIQSKLIIKLFLICFIFFILELMRFQNFSLSDFFKYLKPVLIFFVFYNFSKIIGNGNFALKIILIILSLSIFVSTMQFYNFDFFWSIRNYMPTIEDEFVNNQIENRIRPPGLAYYSVQLQYQLQTILVPLSIFFFKSKKFKLIILFLLIYSFILGLKSFFASILIYLFMINKKKLFFEFFNIYLLFIIIIFLILYLVNFQLFFVDWSLVTRNWYISLDARLSYWISGFYLILNNFFGVENIQESLNDLTYKSNFLSEYILSREYLFNSAYHNIFINIGLNYGWFGIILMVYIYKMLYSHFNLNDPKSILSLSGKAFLISNLILVFTHNSGPLTVDPYFWIITGILAGLSRSSRNIKEQKS
jgi:hypothetical protein